MLCILLFLLQLFTMNDIQVYQDGDYFLTPFYIIIILIIGFYVQMRKIKDKSEYKYYFAGLAVKLFASIIFLLVYTEYYGGGDTVDYIHGSRALSELMMVNFRHYLNVFFNITPFGEAWWYFPDCGSYPEAFPPYYMWRDANTRFVMCITGPINLLGMRYYMTTTVLTAAFSYIGTWKLYLFFVHYYPQLKKQLAIAVLFIPSVVFWGSGVMKDTFTLAAASWLIFNVFQIFQKKEKIVLNVILAIINSYLIISIKPYVFVAFFPGAVIWLLFNRLQNIKNRVMRAVSMPLLIMIMFSVVMFVFSSLQGGLGGYGSYEDMMTKAQTIQEDLTRESQYGSNYYDIGKIDGTTSGLIKIMPAALLAGIYRPFLWEAKNPVMFISGFENFILLIITLFLIIRLKVFRFFQYLFSEPVLIFSILYSIFFLFAVGLASANFGALVRYKIPALPFFVASIFIMIDKHNRYREKKLMKELEIDQPQ